MLHVGGVRHIRPNENRVAATAPEPLDHSGPAFLVDIAHDEPCTGAREGLTGGPADTGSSSGDEHHFPQQFLAFHKAVYGQHACRPRRVAVPR